MFYLKTFVKLLFIIISLFILRNIFLISKVGRGEKRAPHIPLKRFFLIGHNSDLISLWFFHNPYQKNLSNTVYLWVVLIFSNDAPGLQSATAEWRFNWDSYMSSAKDFIVVTADVRGSGQEPRTFSDPTKLLSSLKITPKTFFFRLKWSIYFKIHFRGVPPGLLSSQS